MIYDCPARVGKMIAVLVLGYTGFATIQDIAAIWRTGTGLPYKNPPAANDGESQPGASQP